MNRLQLREVVWGHISEAHDYEIGRTIKTKISWILWESLRLRISNPPASTIVRQVFEQVTKNRTDST